MKFLKTTGAQQAATGVRIRSPQLRWSTKWGQKQQPNYFKKIPSSSGYLNKKNKLGLMGKLKNLPRDIKSAIVKIIPQNGSPQDEYSEKSKKELEELLRSKLNKWVKLYLSLGLLIIRQIKNKNLKLF